MIGRSSADGESVIFTDDNWCFACGVLNPIGLKLVFSYGPVGVQAEFVGDQRYQGYAGYLHGGIISTLLDEAFAHAVISRFGPAVTAEMAVRFRQPAPLGERLVLTATCEEPRRRLVQAAARLTSATGDVLAEATAKFMLVPGELRRELTEQF